MINLVMGADDKFDYDGCFQGLDPASSDYRWWSKVGMVAVVTGANKGIGFALAKRLAELGLRVVLTARDEKRGREAVESIKTSQGGADVDFFRLDVCKPGSIAAFASWFRGRHGHLDILVNNAGVCFNDIHQNSLHQADTVIATNFHGPRLLIQALLPCMLSGSGSGSGSSTSTSTSRILNITSRLGSLNKLKDAGLRAAMEDVEKLSEEKILGMVELFLSEVKETLKIKKEGMVLGGWPEVWTDYSVSKLALNAYSKLLARRFKPQELSVNCFCPGFTQTSMTRGQGSHTPDHAAAIAASLVLLPPHRLPTGIFFLASPPPPPPPPPGEAASSSSNSSASSSSSSASSSNSSASSSSSSASSSAVITRTAAASTTTSSPNRPRRLTMLSNL